MERKIGNTSTCPACGHPVVREGPFLVCNNRIACSAQLRESVLHILRKFDIKGLAEKTLDAIIANGLVTEPWGVFGLTEEALVGAGFGKRESQIIVESLRSVEAKATNILAAVGVEMWGRRMFAKLQRLAPAFTDERLLAGDFPYDEVASVSQVGEVRARVLADAFGEGGHGKEFLANLLKWVRPSGSQAKAVSIGGKLAGLSFCLSGTMPRGKKQIAQDITAAGGEIKDGVSKDLSYLVAGEGSGSKSEKAAKYGIRVITEDELYQMMMGG